MSTTRVVIIGGGLAGLTTAYRLSKKDFLEGHSFEITLLEATSLLGGRVRTLHEFSPSLYAEAGALTFCDTETEIFSLVKELNLELIDRSVRGAKKYFTSTTDVFEDWRESIPNQYFKKYIIDSIPPSLNNKEKSVECMELDKISLLDFLKSKVEQNNKINEINDIKNVLHAIKLSILGLYCDDFSQISAFHALQWISQYKNAKQSFSIKGGNDQLPLALACLASSQGVTILKNSPVIKINRPTSINKTSVVSVVSLDKYKKETVFTCDYLIVAVPLSALRKMESKEGHENYIKFEPELPLKRKSAIQSIPYNRSIARIYFEFNDRFWLTPSQKTAMIITDTPTLWIEDHSDHIESKSAVLEVHAAGVSSKMLQNNKAESLAKKQLECIWGKDKIISNLAKTSAISHCWNREFYQKGDYTYLNVGQAEYPELLSQSLPLISFAGEYTSKFNSATMNGAIQSATRVVCELQKTIQSRKDLEKEVPSQKKGYSFWLKRNALVITVAAVGITIYMKTRGSSV